MLKGSDNPEAEKMERDRKDRPKGVETPGQRFGRLITQAVTHTLAMQDNARDPSSETYIRAQEGLAAVHDEFRTRCLRGNGFDGMLQCLFDMRVTDRLIAIHEDRRDRRRAEKLAEVLAEKRNGIKGDWPIIRTEFPGQFEEADYEHQATLGDPPAVDIVNFGNHHPRKKTSD